MATVTDYQGGSAPDQAVSSPPIRAVLVDDSSNFRSELRNLLELDGIQIAGEGRTGWDAIELVQHVEPDVVVMDQNMPALSGIAATRQILRAKPEMRVIFLAAEDSWREQALRAGAEGYFVKGDDLEQFIRVVKEPGLAEALQWSQAYQGSRRAAGRRIALALIGTGVLVLLAALFLLPPDWYPAFGLLFVLFSLILFAGRSD